MPGLVECVDNSVQAQSVPEVNGYGQFVTRVSTMPIVTSAMDQLTTIYKQTKDKNKLFKATLETAESGVKVAVHTAKPIVNKLETPSKSY